MHYKLELCLSENWASVLCFPSVLHVTIPVPLLLRWMPPHCLPAPAFSCESGPLSMIGEFLWHLEAFLNIWQMSTCFVHSFHFFRKSECKMSNCFTSGSSNVLGCEIAQPMSAACMHACTWTHTCMHARLIAYMLLVDGLVKYSGPINFQRHFCG